MEILKSPEIMLLAGIAVSGGVFLWKVQRTLAADFSGLRTEVKKGFSALRTEVKEAMREIRGDVSSLRSEVSSLGQRIAKMEGLLLPAPNVTQSQMPHNT